MASGYWLAKITECQKDSLKKNFFFATRTHIMYVGAWKLNQWRNRNKFHLQKKSPLPHFEDTLSKRVAPIL